MNEIAASLSLLAMTVKNIGNGSRIKYGMTERKEMDCGSWPAMTIYNNVYYLSFNKQTADCQEFLPL